MALDATSRTRSGPLAGCGVGLRSEHYSFITENLPPMDWFEAVSENFMDTGGRPLAILEKIRARYPVALHGVALSIGSADPLDRNYLTKLKTLADRIEPAIVSDHLCWSSAGGEHLHDLLPLPYTEEAIRHITGRVAKVQEALSRRILLENVSTYVTYKHSVIPEWEFLAEVARRSGCGILLDLNNVFVNSVNHKFDPAEYVRRIPGECVEQFHLAGHTDMGKFLFDTHSGKVIRAVWALYRQALEQWGPVPALIGWDEKIPSSERLAAEAVKARAVAADVSRHPEAAQRPKDLGILRRRTPPQNDVGLGKIQIWMKTHIHPRPRGAKNGSKSPLNPQGGEPGIRRMRVYESGYRARVRDALKETYEATAHLLGDKVFSGLAFAYAASRSSSHYNLSRAGDVFPSFLAKQPAARRFPFLPDLARFEALVARSFHARDRAPIRPEDLAGFKPGDFARLKFEFQPSTALFKSKWPVMDLWQARKTPRNQIRIGLEGRSQRILIRREGFSVRAEALDERAYRLLELLLAGRPMGQALSRLESLLEGPELTAWFKDWTGRGLVVSLF